MSFDKALAKAKEAINNAMASFTGKAWTSGPDELLALLEKGKLTTDFDGGHGWWTASGTYEAQMINRSWRKLLDDIDNTDPQWVTGDVIQAFVERCQEFVDAEDAHVEEVAEEAADLGRQALERIDLGDYVVAVDLLRKAAKLEMEFGDDPSWGPAVKAAIDLCNENELANAERRTPSETWECYVGCQSVHEWVDNGGAMDEDGLLVYLDTLGWVDYPAAAAVIAKKLAEHIAATSLREVLP